MKTFNISTSRACRAAARTASSFGWGRLANSGHLRGWLSLVEDLHFYEFARARRWSIVIDLCLPTIRVKNHIIGDSWHRFGIHWIGTVNAIYIKDISNDLSNSLKKRFGNETLNFSSEK